MNSKPHDATTATARRILEKSKEGMRVTGVEMAKIVEWMEQKDQALSEARAELARVREMYKAAAPPRPDDLLANRGWEAGWYEAMATVNAALSQPAAEQPASAGDWRCPNCGYIDAQRVTFEETCDACHASVCVGLTEENAARAALAAAIAAPTKGKE